MTLVKRCNSMFVGDYFVWTFKDCLNVNILSQEVQPQFSIQSRHPALHGNPLNEIHIQVAAALDGFQSSCSKSKNQDCHNFTIYFLYLGYIR